MWKNNSQSTKTCSLWTIASCDNSLSPRVKIRVLVCEQIDMYVHRYECHSPHTIWTVCVLVTLKVYFGSRQSAFRFVQMDTNPTVNNNKISMNWWTHATPARVNKQKRRTRLHLNMRLHDRSVCGASRFGDTRLTIDLSSTPKSGM